MGYLTKKYPKDSNDLSIMIEETINLSEIEFKFFKESLNGKVLEKTRYSKSFDTYQIDLDVYTGNLAPLIILDIEISAPDLNIDEVLKGFDIETEVTNQKQFAGGLMAGKTYNEIMQK
jgi:CYTH domain-containing protein